MARPGRTPPSPGPRCGRPTAGSCWLPSIPTSALPHSSAFITVCSWSPLARTCSSWPRGRIHCAASTARSAETTPARSTISIPLTPSACMKQSPTWPSQRPGSTPTPPCLPQTSKPTCSCPRSMPASRLWPGKSPGRAIPISGRPKPSSASCSPISVTPWISPRLRRKRGHCEYFASSMAILLRTLSIPSRVVNGFRTSEFNDLTGQYVVRASSAHSWVEAYFPDRGWVSFDPTPGAGLVGATGWNRISLYLDAMASFWREWVVNYDASHQRSLGEDAMQKSRSLVESVRSWAQRHYASLLGRARRAQKSFSRSPRAWSALGLFLGLLLLAAGNAPALMRWLQDRRLARHPEQSPSLAAALWYRRLLRWLTRKGWSKTDVQTPREFLLRIPDPATRIQVEDFTRAYEAARFGDSAQDARRLPVLYEEIVGGAKR